MVMNVVITIMGMSIIIVIIIYKYIYLEIGGYLHMNGNYINNLYSTECLDFNHCHWYHGIFMESCHYHRHDITMIY